MVSTHLNNMLVKLDHFRAKNENIGNLQDGPLVNMELRGPYKWPYKSMAFTGVKFHHGFVEMPKWHSRLSWSRPARFQRFPNQPGPFRGGEKK